MDLSELHDAVDRLSRSHNGATYSLSQQVIYFRHFDDAVGANQQAVAQLSTSLKTYAVKIQDTFQEIATKLERGLMRGKSSPRYELEFALTHLEVQRPRIINYLPRGYILLVPGLHMFYP
jgi:hypothetical protein